MNAADGTKIVTIRIRVLAEDGGANQSLLAVSVKAPESAVYGPGAKVLDLAALRRAIDARISTGAI